MLNERLQILVRPDQRRRLESEAQRRGSSVARLVREALDAQFGVVTRADRIGALEEIGKMRGGFLAPEEINRIASQEGEDEADAILQATRR